MPARFGHILGLTDCDPDLSHILAIGDGAIWSSVAKLDQGEITKEHLAVLYPEFIGDEFMKMADAHESTIGEKRIPRRVSAEGFECW